MKLNQFDQINTFGLSLLHYLMKKKSSLLKLLQLNKVMMLKLIISPRLFHMIMVMLLLRIYHPLIVFELLYFVSMKLHTSSMILYHLLSLKSILLFNKSFPHKPLFMGINHYHTSFLLNSKNFKRNLILHWSL